LSTCYPFRFIGSAPKRYIVQADLVIGQAMH
jgi:sortase (surface protein transpeptidase)